MFKYPRAKRGANPPGLGASTTGNSQNTPPTSSHSTTVTAPTSPIHPDFDFSSIHPPKTPPKPARRSEWTRWGTVWPQEELYHVDSPDQVKAQAARRSLSELSPIKVPESPEPLSTPRLTTTPGRIAAWKLWLPPPPLSFGKPMNGKRPNPQTKRSRTEDSDEDETADGSKRFRTEPANEVATSGNPGISNNPATVVANNVGPLDETEVLAAGGGDTLIGTTSATDEPRTVMSTELYREPFFRPAANVTEEKGNAASAGETGGNQPGSPVDGTTGGRRTPGPVFIDLTLSDDEDEGNIPPKTGNPVTGPPAGAGIDLHAVEPTHLFNMLSTEARTLALQFSRNPSKENARRLTFSPRDAEIWKVLVGRTIARADSMSTSTAAGLPGVAAQSRESTVQAQPTRHQVLAPSTAIPQDQNVPSSQHWIGGPVQNNPLGDPFTFRYAVPTQARPVAPSSGSSRMTFPGHERRAPI